MGELFYNRFDTFKERGCCKECDGYRGSGFENPNWIDCPDNCFYKIQELRLLNNKKIKKKNDNLYKNWIFFTLSPDKLKYGSLNLNDYDSLKSWADLWFQNYNYNEYFYAIESGKDENEPHLHIHALVKGLNNNLKKNGHYKILKEQWNLRIPLNSVGSLMEKNTTKKSYDILYQCINDKTLWEQKYNYLNNELKGTHKNFTEFLGVPGGS